MTPPAHSFGEFVREPLRLRALRITSYLGFALLVFGFALVFFKVKTFSGIAVSSPQELLMAGLASAAVFYVVRERATLAITLGIFVWVYCIVSFAGSITDAGSGQSSLLKRLSPNGAIALASLGLASSLIARTGRFRIKLLLSTVCSSISGVLAFVAVWGHLVNIREGYTWGASNELSLFLAVWILVASVAVGFASQAKLLETGSGFRGMFAIPAGLTMALGALLLSAALSSHQGYDLAHALQQQNDLTKRLLESTQNELITLAQQQYPTLQDKSEKSKASVFTVDIPHPAVKKAIFVKDRSVDPGAPELKELASSESIKKLLDSNESIFSSAPFAGAEDVPLLLVSIKRRSESGSAARVVLRVSIPEVAVPALSWCRDCVAQLRRFEEAVVNVGGPEAGVGALAVSEQIEFFGGKGWTIQTRPTANFIKNGSQVHPYLVPLAFIGFTLTASLAAWLALKLRATDALVHEIQRTFGGAQAYREKASEALDIIRDYVITIDSSERIMYMNRAAKHALTGETEEDLYLADIYPTHVLTNFRKTGFVKVRNRQAWATDASLRDRFGVEFPVDQAIIAHLDAEDRPFGYTLIAHDLREESQKAATPQIDPRDHWQPALMEILATLSVPAWITDSNRAQVLGVSRELREIFSATFDDLLHDESAWLERVCGEDQKRIRDELRTTVGARGKETKYKIRIKNKDIPIRHFRLPLNFGEAETRKSLVLNFLVAQDDKSKSLSNETAVTKEIVKDPQPEVLLEFLTTVLGETARQIDRLLSVMILEGAQRPAVEIKEDLTHVRERAQRLSAAIFEVSEVVRCEKRVLATTEFEIGAEIDSLARDVLSGFSKIKVNMHHFAGVTLDKDMVDTALRSVFLFVSGWAVNDSSIELTLKADEGRESVTLTVLFNRMNAELQKGATWFLPLCTTSGGTVKPGLAVAQSAVKRIGGEVLINEGKDHQMILRVTLPTPSSQKIAPKTPRSGLAAAFDL